MRDQWHEVKEPGRYTLARRLPVRFDVAVTTAMPALRKDRLALQVRQDLWRALQRVRGFSPVVRVTETGTGCEVTAGGRVDGGTVPRQRMEETIAGILDDPARRARWARFAARKAGAVALAMLALPALTAGLATADPVPVEVPSGQPVSLVGVLLDDGPGALWARFRFVAPEMTADSAEAAAGDMDHLCSAVAAPYVSHHRIEPARIVISLSDRDVEFGKAAANPP